MPEGSGMRMQHGSEGLQLCTLSQVPETGLIDGHEGPLCLGAASLWWLLAMSGQNHKMLKLAR